VNKAELRAWASSLGAWGQVGGIDRGPLYAKAVNSPRQHMRYCWKCKALGVKARADHVGMSNGVALTDGCQFHVMQWVRSKGRS
jgi:hypothetical protein